MRICGIVCEYNPFHNGHLHHITMTRRQGFDAVVCVMSGNFVQRAEFAIMPKSARAQAAVNSGADLVIELPLPFAIASAERFATGAVSILDSLGCVSHISFGAEAADITALSEAAEILSDSSIFEAIKAESTKGVSFAAARERAVAKISKQASALLTSPNNILAIEYIKALKALRSSVLPIAVPRLGAAHDGDTATDGFASASKIRELIKNGEDFSDFVPDEAFKIITRELEDGHSPVFPESIDRAILASLKKLSPEDFCRYGDVSEGLEFRLYDAVQSSSSLSEATERAKTKRYAHSRIRRAFLNAFLDIPNSLAKEAPPYARVLAMTDTGREIIKLCKKTSKIPIITKSASIKNESEKAKSLLALESRSDDIYSLFMKNPLRQGFTYTNTPFIKEN